MKSKQLYFSIILIFLLAGCSKRVISFKENRINKYYKRGFLVKLNDDIINPEFYFLDRNNIKKTIFLKHQKTILVHQNDTSTQYTVLARIIEHAKTNTTKEIKMVVINGIPFSTDNFNTIKIENNSIKNIQHLKVDSLAIQSCFGQGGDILLIRTN